MTSSASTTAYWIAAWVGNAAIAVAFAGYLGVFWGDVNTTNWLAALVAIEQSGCSRW